MDESESFAHVQLPIETVYFLYFQTANKKDEMERVSLFKVKVTRKNIEKRLEALRSCIWDLTGTDDMPRQSMTEKTIEYYVDLRWGIERFDTAIANANRFVMKDEPVKIHKLYPYNIGMPSRFTALFDKPSARVPTVEQIEQNPDDAASVLEEIARDLRFIVNFKPVRR